MSTAPTFDLIPTSFGSSTLRLVPVVPATKSAREQLAEARSRRAKKTASSSVPPSSETEKHAESDN